MTRPRIVFALMLACAAPSMAAADGTLPHSFLVAEAPETAPTPWGVGGENPDAPQRHTALVSRLHGGATGLVVGGVLGALYTILVPGLGDRPVKGSDVAIYGGCGAAAGFLVGFLLAGGD